MIYIEGIKITWIHCNSPRERNLLSDLWKGYTLKKYYALDENINSPIVVLSNF